MANLRVVDGATARAVHPDRVLGEDVRAERELLANFMIDGALVEDVRPFLKPEYFHGEAHRRTCEAAFFLSDERTPVNVTTVATRLRDTGRLAQVGGVAYLTELLGDCAAVTSAQAIACARSVRDKWVRRSLTVEGLRAKARGESDTAPIDQIVAEHRAALDNLVEVLSASEKSARAPAVVDRTLKELADATKTDGRGARPSGFDRLDRLTAGLPSDLTIVAARPGMGKTSLATSIALHRARAGEGVLIASLETTDTKLATRILCAEARVSLVRCLAGSLSPAEWARVLEASKAVATLPLWLEDEAGLTAFELWAKCRRVKLQLAREGKKLGLVVVDYVQLLRSPRAGMKREEVVAENARTLKHLAGDLDVPVLALAQLNRDVEKRQDKRPVLSDLRESGELEQCARLVVCLYRDEVYRPKTTADRGIAELIVRKANNGPTGTVRLRFDAETLRFENIVDGPTVPDLPLCGGCGQRRPVVGGQCFACGTQRAGHASESLFPQGFEPTDGEGRAGA